MAALFLFVILFVLSIYYHVLIIGRIREAYDNGMRTNDAIAHELSRQRDKSPARR